MESELIVLNLLVGSLLKFGLHLVDLLLVDLDFGGGKYWRFDQCKVGIIGELSEEPDERFLVLVIALGRDVIVLKVLLSVEGNLFSLHFSVFDVNLVSDKHDGDVRAHSSQVLVPLGHVLVSDSGAHVKHDNSAVASDAINHS